MSVTSMVPVFSTTKLIVFDFPAVKDELRFPSGVDNCKSYFPVTTASRVASSVVEPLDATIGISYDRGGNPRSEEHTSELQSRGHLVCRLLLEKKKKLHNTLLRTTS